MRIGNNISAMNTLNRLTVNNSQLSKSLEKLSSGSAINRASDDAAGLAISEKMRAQIAGLEQASKNAQDGISLVQTAEGALDQTHTALRRMYTLAMQAKNGTITTDDRQKIQDEINARINEIDRVADTANFNGIKLFDGSLDQDIAFAAPTVAGSTLSAGTTALTLSAIAVHADANTDELKNAFVDALSEGISFDTTAAAITQNSIKGKDGYTYTATADDSILVAKDGTNLGTVSFGGVAVAGSASIEFDGTKAGKALELQIGATSSTADKIDVSINKMDAESLLVQADGTTSALVDLSEDGDGSLMSLDMTTPEAASAAIDSINKAIEKVSTQRAGLGAVQNRLEQTIENLSTTAENMSAAESRIRDVDMAKEMTNFTKNSILSQASQAMLAQANALPQGVLQLLG